MDLTSYSTTLFQTENKTRVELQLTETPIGQLTVVFLDGLFKVFGSKEWTVLTSIMQIGQTSQLMVTSYLQLQMTSVKLVSIGILAQLKEHSLFKAKATAPM